MTNPAISRRRFLRTLAASGILFGCRPGRPFSVQPLDRGAAGEQITLPLRLNRNESPYGPFPSAVEALATLSLRAHRYPQAETRALEYAIAEAHGLSPGQVLVGCGSIELLKLAADVLCSPSVPPLLGEPVFEAIEYYASLRRIPPLKVPLTADFQQDLEEMAQIAASRDCLVYLCNPANPSGTLLSGPAVAEFLDRVPGRNIVVVDEAYAEYASGSGFESCLRLVRGGIANLLVLRTFSKLYGLAGLRVGYAAGPEKLLQSLRAHRLWSGVNQAAAAAALASLGDGHSAGLVRHRNAEIRKRLCLELERLGVDYIPAAANFLMFRSPGPAADLIARLRERGVLVGRLFPSMPRHVRVTLGLAEEMGLFGRILAEVL